MKALRRLTRTRLAARPTWLLANTIGFVTLATISVLHQEADRVLWYLGVLGAGAALVLIGQTSVFRLVARTTIALNAWIVPVMALAAGFGLLRLWHDPQRLALHTANPNLLAADLVIGYFTLLLLRPELRSLNPILGPATLLAIIFTGSRTALIGFLVALTIWLLLRSTPSQSKRLAVITLGTSAAVLGGVLFLSERVASASHNLLAVSTTLAHEAWSAAYAQSWDVQGGATTGPNVRESADRIQGQAKPGSTLVVFQSIGLSSEGQPYVASIFLRSDTTQAVVLSSHLSHVRCHVGEQWSRCVTPTGSGDGHRHAQLRIEALEPGGGFDIYVFGPQLEGGSVVRPYQRKPPALIHPAVIERFALRRSSSADAQERLAAAIVGVKAFLDSPWIGVGELELRSRLSNEGRQEPGAISLGHTHNLLVELLASVGVIGVSGWALSIGLGLFLAAVRLRAAIAPLLAALIILNTTDYTLFHAGSIWPLWVVMALMLSPEPIRA